MRTERQHKPITAHITIDGFMHRLIATRLGRKEPILYMGYHYDGYALNGVMHIDMESVRPMQASDRPHVKNVVVPLRIRRTTS